MLFQSLQNNVQINTWVKRIKKLESIHMQNLMIWLEVHIMAKTIILT